MEAGAEQPGAEVEDEGVEDDAVETPTLGGGEVLEVGGEAGECLEGGHGGLLRAARRGPRQ
ncbi:hypothetical protein DIZ27_04780 [Streptomyces sp. NWU339]|nr:hypothetical protein DIZ27_04780 [Streptomyces sp. NWU339]